MRKSIWALAATGFGSVFATVSFASGTGSWSGFYVGLETGVARNIVRLEEPSTPIDETIARTGALVGAFTGYDHQIGDFVIGGVADLDYVGTPDLVFQGKADTHHDMSWAATARVRAGFAPSNQLLLYGTGGIAFAGVKGTFGSIVGPTPIKSIETGYVIGAGAEYRFNRNWSLKGEYLHYDFGKIEDDSGSGATFKPRMDAFKIGVAYRF